MALTPADITQITNLIEAQLAANRIKISQLPAAGSLSRDAIFPVVDSGSTQKVTLSVLQGLSVIVVAVGQDLRAADPDTLIDGQMFYTTGVDTPNDGGEGLWIYDAASLAVDNIGTVIAPDAGIGRFLRQFTGLINVKWFEAKGDGSTDDTAAIALAIAACNVGSGYPTTAARGRGLFFPQGNYLVSSILIPYSGMVMAGDSRGGTFITLDGSSEKGIYTPAAPGPGIGGSEVINLSFRDFSIDMANIPNDPDYHALHIENSFGNSIERVYCLNQQIDCFGLAIWRNAYTTSIRDCTFQNVIIEGYNGNFRSIEHIFDNVDLYHVKASYAGSLAFRGCAIQSNYDEKFLLNIVNGLSVENCDIEGNSEVVYRGNCTNLNERANILAGLNLSQDYTDPDGTAFLSPEFQSQGQARADGYNPTEGGRYTPLFGNGIYIPSFASPDPSLTYAFIFDRLLRMLSLRIRGSCTGVTIEQRLLDEQVQSIVEQADAVSLVDSTAKDITTIELDGGIWDIFGWGYLNPTTVTATALRVGINIDLANTLPALDGSSSAIGDNAVVNGAWGGSIPSRRIAIANGDTKVISLTAYASFSAGTIEAWGGLMARRQGSGFSP